MRRVALLALTVVLATAACSSDGGSPDRTAEPDPTAATTTSTAPAEVDPATTAATGATPAADDLVEVLPAVEPIGEVVHGELATADGRTRTYRLYRPTDLADDAPLLLALHGGTGSGDQFAATSGYEGLAEANGFLLAFPDGTPTALGPERLVWNAGGCCAAAVRDDVDDVAFLAALVDELAASEGIDPARVLVTGHSNGAMMGLRLACEASDRVVAVAVQAGTVFVDDCRPTRPVSVLDVHGTADENVPVGGGRGPESAAGVDFPPVRAGLAALATAAGCEDRDAPLVGPGPRPGTTLESWAPCPAGVAVELLTVDGADHAWMGSPKADRDDVPFTKVSAAELTWTFLSNHR